MYYTVSWICEDFDGLGSGTSKYIEHFDNHEDASLLYCSITDQPSHSWEDDEGYFMCYHRSDIELTTTDGSIPELRSVEVVLD